MTAGWKVRGYDLERLLGRGASGEVWRARIQGSGEAVALKRLVVTDEHQRRRARTEAATLTVLDHPNLVRLHDVVLTDDAAVLVLDLADGGSLADLLTVRGRLTPPEVITVVAPVAAALAYVHRSGVVHGDVTPANILFTPGGVALLADLGVARLTGDDADAESTPAYIDPAVAAGSVPGPVSDVFMLGAVALHALTGAVAWPGPDTAAALAAARAGELGDVAARLTRAGVPEAMAAVVLRALVVDPHHRCTAADLALDLRHSGTPIAVELSAGRERPPADELPNDGAVDGDGPTTAAGPSRYGRTSPRVGGAYGPRHAALPPSGVVTGAGPALRARVAPAGAGASTPPGAPPPTAAVARPRPVIPRRRPPRLKRRHAVAVSAVLVVLVGGAVAVAAARPGADPAPRARHPAAVAPKPAASTPKPAASTPKPTSSIARPAVTPTTPSTPTASATWTAELRRLDALRALAFATGDTGVLGRVYASGPLLSADTALLTRLVPPGCGLVGATTRYEQIRVTATPGRAVVLARAGIATSTLRCPHRAERRAAAIGPTPVRLELVRTAQGVRIAGQQVG